jgi:hypothetical protein
MRLLSQNHLHASRHVNATFYVQHFFIGTFLKESPPSHTVNFGNATISYRF